LHAHAPMHTHARRAYITWAEENDLRELGGPVRSEHLARAARAMRAGIHK
jgi:hypothetical protein